MAADTCHVLPQLAKRAARVLVRRARCRATHRFMPVVPSRMASLEGLAENPGAPSMNSVRRTGGMAIFGRPLVATWFDHSTRGIFVDAEVWDTQQCPRSNNFFP
jgi:hypothetical protein